MTTIVEPAAESTLIDSILPPTDFSTEAIALGQLSATVGDVTEALASGDSPDPSFPDTFMDQYQLTDVTPGQLVTISMISTEFNPYLRVMNEATGEVVATDDNSGPGANAQLQFIPEADVNYIVGATNATTATETGNYLLGSTSMDITIASLFPLEPTIMPFDPPEYIGGGSILEPMIS